MKQKTTSAIIFYLLMQASASYAQVRLDVIGPGMPKYPIAISPLKNTGNGADPGRISEGVADAIVYDLDLSGWFRVLDRATYIEHPQRSGDTLGTFDFKDWSTIGAVGLVKGRFSVQGDEVTVELRLFDVTQGRETIGKRYTGRARDFRRIAHKFADEIIKQFTGVPGIFNTRIAYTSTGGGRFKEIHVAHLDGSEKYQVTNNRTINLSPSWTPDGKSILYTSYKERNPSLYLFELFSGKDLKFSSRTGLNLGGKWSPDGQNVAVSLERGEIPTFTCSNGMAILCAGSQRIRPSMFRLHGRRTVGNWCSFRTEAGRPNSIFWMSRVANLDA